MNAITPAGGHGLVPQNMNDAIRLAEMMARGKMLPEHLRNPGDALMIVEQAMRWRMSPYAVAQSTFSIKGKLLFAGTLVAAAIEHSGAIVGLMDYQFSGSGADRKIVVSATRHGETVPKTVEVALKDAITANDIWKKQPDQQLCYHGTRVWARRWTPGVMLGIYTPEEFATEAPAEPFAGPTIEAEAAGTREAVNEAVPVTPRKPTVTEWLDELERELVLATDTDAVDGIVARDQVQKAIDTLKNGALARLNAMVKAALDRTSVAADAAFLGAGETMES